MKDALFALVMIIGMCLLVWWVDVPKAFDQDMGLYKKHHVNAVKCTIK
jgi:hypothetical protein